MATENVSESVDEKALEDMANFGPWFNDSEMKKLEAYAGGLNIGRARRIALVVMARGAGTLSEMSLTEPEAYGEMRDAVAEFLAHAKWLFGVAETAEVRLAIADCREDAAI